MKFPMYNIHISIWVTGLPLLYNHIEIFQKLSVYVNNIEVPDLKLQYCNNMSLFQTKNPATI